jgi:hypothetical protein
MTVAAPGPVIVPVGPGIGPTHAANETMSPTRAAGFFSTSTFGEPCVIVPGPPGTQLGIMQAWVMLPMVAAGIPAILTVIAQFIWIGSGMGGCGIGVGTGAGGCMGAWQCGALCIVMSF